MTRRALVGLFLVGLAWPAAAQSTLADEFEGNLLDSEVPPGAWGYRVVDEAANFFGTSADAGKSGSRGLRILDSPQPSLLALVGPAVIAPRACVRYVIELRNGFDGGPAPAPVTTFITLSQTSDAGVTFSDVSTCANSIPGVQVATGVSGAELYLHAAANERITVGTRTSTTRTSRAPCSSTGACPMGGRRMWGRPMRVQLTRARRMRVLPTRVRRTQGAPTQAWRARRTAALPSRT